MKYIWDRDKAESNQIKHGISFEEATSVFKDPLAITIPDPIHSIGEYRYITIGSSVASNLIVVVHTESGYTLRIISARKATKHERRQYEQGYH